jgi:hypothetical protein
VKEHIEKMLKLSKKVAAAVPLLPEAPVCAGATYRRRRQYISITVKELNFNPQFFNI